MFDVMIKNNFSEVNISLRNLSQEICFEGLFLWCARHLEDEHCNLFIVKTVVYNFYSICYTVMKIWRKNLSGDLYKHQTSQFVVDWLAGKVRRRQTFRVIIVWWVQFCGWRFKISIFVFAALESINVRDTRGRLFCLRWGRHSQSWQCKHQISYLKLSPTKLRPPNNKNSKCLTPTS